MDNFNDGKQKKGAVSNTAPSEQTKLLNPHNTSINNQHAICLRVLAISPQSTIDLRHTYSVMMTGARIKELRNLGHDIATVRVTQTTPDNWTSPALLDVFQVPFCNCSNIIGLS